VWLGFGSELLPRCLVTSVRLYSVQVNELSPPSSYKFSVVMCSNHCNNFHLYLYRYEPNGSVAKIWVALQPELYSTKCGRT